MHMMLMNVSTFFTNIFIYTKFPISPLFYLSLGQFVTRQMNTKGEVLPFFQSYICTISNECISPKHYEDVAKFNEAPYVK